MTKEEAKKMFEWGCLYGTYRQKKYSFSEIWKHYAKTLVIKSVCDHDAPAEISNYRQILVCGKCGQEV